MEKEQKIKYLIDRKFVFYVDGSCSRFKPPHQWNGLLTKINKQPH